MYGKSEGSEWHQQVSLGRSPVYPVLTRAHLPSMCYMALQYLNWSTFGFPLARHFPGPDEHIMNHRLQFHTSPVACTPILYIGALVVLVAC